MELAVTNSCKKKINIIIYFENKFHIFYILNIHVKFFINQLINLFFMHILDYKNLKFKYLIDNIIHNL